MILGDQARSARGQWLGAGIGIVAVVGGIVLLAMDKSVEGFASIGTAFTGLVAVFAIGRWLHFRERRQKFYEYPTDQ